MGVLGLWQLLAPVGQPVTLESLENKIFAVDISIWLNQALKGYRDAQGGSVPNAHLLSLFSRLCKLLFYKIRPIIVFDGGYPELKKQTILNRREAVKHSCRNTGLKILANYVASQQLNSVVESNSGKKSNVKPKPLPEDIFKLPPLPETTESEDKIHETFDLILSKEDIKYLNKIDIDSEDFNSLPPDVKQEILSTLKQSRRHRTWEQFEEMPKESNEFSSYQMQCLLKRRRLQGKLEEVQRDMRIANSADFIAQYTGDHVIGESSKIMSDDTSHYVLLKKMSAATSSKDISETSKQNLNVSSSMADTKNAFIKSIENIDVDDPEVIIENFTFSENDDVDKKNSFMKSLENIDVDDPDYVPEKCVSSVENSNKIITLKEESSDSDSCTYSIKSDSELFIIQSDNKSDEEQKIKSSNNFFNLQENSNASDNLKTITESPLLSSVENRSTSENELVQPYKTNNASIKINNSCDENYEMKSFDKPEINDGVCPSTSENVHILSKDEVVHCKDADEKIKLNKTSNYQHTDIYTNELKSPNTTEGFTENVSSSGSKVPFDSNIKQINVISNSSHKPVDNIPLKESSISSNDFMSASEDDETLNDVTIQSSSEDEVLSYEALQSNLQLQSDLETATIALEAEQAKQERQNRTVQEHMIEECKDLLKLFGIPFIVSSLEAEAQCAFYDIMNLTHGTITDDSDVWLFGGKRVYKNFFAQQKFVEFYKDKEIFSNFGLSRLKLVNFAMLTGSDYTVGIEGVGPVTAMEIISEFSGDGIDALQKFKDWWETSNKTSSPPKNKVRAKLRKLTLSEGFPDSNVYEAYMNPEVDQSTETFTWGRPDLDALREYTKEKFNWSKSKVDDMLLPVIKKLNERVSQTHLDSFFTVSLKKETNLFPSKRIMSALKKIAGCDEPEAGSSTKKGKRKAPSSQKAVPKKVSKKTSKSDVKKSSKKVHPKHVQLSEESSSSEDNS